MTIGRGGRSRVRQMAPYFVQLREFERRLLAGALREAEGLTLDAAALLGLHEHYFRARATHLGGVLPGDPRREPPDKVIKAWNKTSPAGPKGRGRRMPRRTHVLDVEPDA